MVSIKAKNLAEKSESAKSKIETVDPEIEIGAGYCEDSLQRLNEENNRDVVDFQLATSRSQ